MITSSLRCRSRLLAGCALMLGAVPAFAQSYPDRALQGDSTVVSGTVTVGRTPLRDTVTVSSAQAIINWNPETGPLPLPPSPAPINFLPNGREAVFQGATLGQDFVVLNRILPSTNRAISINGTVTSQIVTGFGGGPPPLPTYGRGGSVWFYSPGGIIAGSTSVFNVGNLILTANDIDATGGLFSGAGAIRFRSAANSVAAVTVQPGAQFNQPNAGSYLALVSPQVTMGGTATVNGSAAYVAAEQVDITLNGGFFSIGFLTGTGVANALTHNGTTTGPAGTGVIAMAAMPKNTAITMLVGGTVGYTPAATATVQNGTIVLSAGQDVVFGNITPTGSATAANLNIGSGLFRSQVNAQATNITVAPTGGVATTFTSDANLTGLTSASVQVDAGQSMTVGGTLNIVSRRAGTGGLAGITVNGGTLSVAGQTLLNTNAFGVDNFAGAGGNGTGGQSRLTVNGGTVTLGDTLLVTADGIGGGGTTTSGNGIGGTAAVTLNGGLSPTLLNLSGISHQITANGSINGQFPSVNGGNATGGAASLTINSGTMNSIELAVNATAIGGEATTGIAGVASGGSARILMTGGQFNTRTLTLNANERQGAAGPGGTAGATTGSGLAAVDVSGTGVLAVGTTGGNSMTLAADAIKAGARLGAPIAGGNLVAGTARLTATSGGTITADATAPSAPKPPVLLSASVLFNDNIVGAPAASQRAGTVLVNADGGTMSLHALDMRANALVRDFALPNDPAGPSFGGTATMAARNGGSLTVRAGSGATLLSAFATGGSPNVPALGTGGTINVLAQGGTLALPDGLTADVRGYSGSGTTLGGVGGTVNVSSTAGAAGQAGTLSAGTTVIDASGQVSVAFPNATAGNIFISNTGPGQAMTFGSLDAVAGTASPGTSGSITVASDNTPINVTTTADLRTLGNLALTMTGLTGRLNVTSNFAASGFNTTLSHLGVAPGTNLTSISAGQAFIQAGDRFIPGNDLLFVGPATVRAGFVRLTARRDIGGADGAAFSTGNLEIGNARNVAFRTLDANGTLFGYNGVSSTTPFLEASGTVVIGNNLRIGTGNIDVRAGTGIDIADAGTSATGQVLLRSTTGDVRLATSGVALATRPNGITLTATGGTARFVNIFSRASITIAGAAGVVGGNASAALGISATSANGGVTVDNVQATSTTLTAATNIVAGSVFGQTGVTLTATTGSIAATSVTAPGGSIAATGATGVDIADAGTGATGQILLTSTTGDVRLGTSGLPPATRSNGITLNALAGTARFTDLRSAGVITVSGRSGVVGGDANSFTGLQLTSGSGAVVAGTLSAPAVVTNAATSITLGSAIGGIINLNATSGSVQANSVSGSTTVTAATGITIPIVSGNSINLSSPLGAITVATNLAPTGALTVNGRSLFLRSIGSLTTGTLTATGAAGIDVAAGGALTLTSAQAANGPVTLAGATGLTVPTIVSGGTTSLNAANGAISVATNLQSAGLVTASGRSVFLRATAGLNASALTATAGSVDVSSGGSLTVANVQTTVDAILNSGAVLTPGTVTAGRDIVLTAVSVDAISLTAPRDLRIVTTGLARATGTIAATGALTVNAGQTNFQTVNGGSVAITSGQGVIFGALTSGSTATLNAGDDVIGTSVTAAGNVAVNAGRNVNFGALQAGGNATLYGNTTAGILTVGGATIGGFLEARGAALNFGNVTAGTDAILSSYNGGLTVGNVTAGDDIFLTVNGSFANAATVSPDSQTGVVSNTVNTLVAGNLRSTGLGSDTAASGPRTFAGAGPTGNVIRVRASGAVQTGTISTGGNAIIVSDLSSITTQAVSAPVGVSVFVRGNANMGDIATTGNFSIGDSSQVFTFVPMYQPFGFGGSQTSTSGGATLGLVTAGLIGGTTRDALVYGSLAATNSLSWTSLQGGITGGALSAGQSLTIRAAGNIWFTTANSGTTTFLTGGGSLVGTSITAGESVGAFSQTGMTVGPVSANGGDVTLSTLSNELRATTVSATRDILIGATDGGALTANVVLGTVTSGGSTRIEGGNVVPGTVVTGAITTGTGLNVSATSVATGDIASGGNAVFETFGGALTIGNATAANLIANSTGSLTTGRVTAIEDIRLFGGPGPALMTTGDLTAGDDIIATGNAITTGNLLTTGLGPDVENNGSTIDLQLNRIATGTANSAGTILYAASQPITFTSTTSRFGTTIRSFGAITGGNSTAGTTLDIQGGSIDTGNGQAGGALNYINFAPADTIRTGTLTGATVTASSRGTLLTGAVNAPGAVNLLGDLGLTVASATSTGGDLQLIAQTSGPIASGALRAGGNLTVTGQAGNDVLTTLDAGGRILIGAGGGTLTFTRATAGGLIGMSADGNIAFGTVQAGGTFQAQTPGSITGTSATSAGGAPNIVQGDAGVTLPTLITNGVTVLSAVNGALVIGTDLRSTAPVSAIGRSIFLRGSGPLAFSTLQATAGNLDVQTAGALNAGAASSTGILALTSTGGALSFTTAQSGGNTTLTAATTVTGTSLTSGGTAGVAANSDITIPTVVATGTVNLAASNGAIRVATNVAGSSVSANGNGIFLRATGPLATNRLSSTADIDVQSVGNLVTDFTEASGNVTFASTTGSVSVNALGVPPADLIPANATITAATTATLNNVQVGNALNVASPGATTINGAVVARIIDIRSGDIVISGQARLGALGTTTQLTLANNSTQNRTTIGGAGTSGYSLSGAEIGRLFGGNITINAPVIGGPASTAFNSARTPDVTVEAFTFAANTNLGATGTFAIVNGGKVRVVGTAGITGAVNGQTFAVRGDEAVEVLDAGAITMNGTGGLAGTIDLTSRNIIASTSAALADFAAASTLSAISDRAGRNDGAVNDGGYLQAGGIRATLLNSTLIIQNTGSATTNANRDYAGRRGFTVGAGGFTVVQGGTNPVRIAINGRQVGATTPLGAPTVGRFVTGLDMIPLIKIRNFDASASDIFQVPPSGVLTSAQLAAAPRLFDTTSTVNGCAITGGSGCRVVPNDPIRDILLGDFGEGSVSNLLPLSLVQLREYVTPEDEPLIDEPVTGAGNDDLWSVDDTKPKCDPAKEKCPA